MMRLSTDWAIRVNEIREYVRTQLSSMSTEGSTAGELFDYLSEQVPEMGSDDLAVMEREVKRFLTEIRQGYVIKPTNFW